MVILVSALSRLFYMNKWEFINIFLPDVKVLTPELRIPSPILCGIPIHLAAVIDYHDCQTPQKAEIMSCLYSLYFHGSRFSWQRIANPSSGANSSIGLCEKTWIVRS